MMRSPGRVIQITFVWTLAALAMAGLLFFLNGYDAPVGAETVLLSPVLPDDYPPAGRDCLAAEAEVLTIDIQGLDPVVFTLSGSASVERWDPYIDPRDAKGTIEIEMVGLTLVGSSPDYADPMTLTLQATPASAGWIKQKYPDTGFPADSFFDVFVEVDMGGETYVSMGPLPMRAEISSIPPISETYSLNASPPPILLINEATGALLGEVVDFRLHMVAELECWFWKAGGWTDYAPSGVPDFDQKQDGWGDPGPPWTYCGPVAVANSLWWLDSKLEPFPRPPEEVNDNFPLVEPYDEWDDHSIANPLPLVEELAGFFGTDLALGTEVHQMERGLQDYLDSRELGEAFTVTLVAQPTFDWVADEVLRSEDVVLLIGFWECGDPTGENCTEEADWARVGGHFVTVAGVDPIYRYVAFSDPYFDRAETGGPGRVLSGTLIPHQLPAGGHPADIHNDAGNVSHDIYRVIDTFSPGGTWGPQDYVTTLDDLGSFVNQNFVEGQELWPGGPPAGPISAEVEYALATSPRPPIPWVLKETGQTELRWNELITYTITVGNDGGMPGYGALVVDTLPEGVTFQGASPEAVHANGVVTMTLPTLAPYSSVPLTVTALVSSGLSIGQPLTNSVALYLGTTVWDRAQATIHITGTQILLPVVLSNATSSRAVAIEGR